MSPAQKTSPNRYPVLALLIVALVLSQAWAQRQRHEKAARLAVERAFATAAAQRGPAPGAPAPAGAVAAASAAAPAATVPGSLAALRAAPWGEDPFWKAPVRNPRPASGIRLSQPGDSPRFILRGILSGGAAPSAQIGDNFVQVGDAVSGWTVTSIDDNSVTLARGAAHVTLHLHEERP